MRIRKLYEIDEEYLNNEITVKEKLIGHRFSFKTDRHGNLKFYGKKSKKQLSILDRFMSDLYEFPIRHIINNNSNILSDDTIYRAYLTKENKIVLSDIERFGKVIDDDSILEPIANALEIDCQKKIFVGYLDEFQKIAILEDHGFNIIFEALSGVGPNNEEGLVFCVKSDDEIIRFKTMKNEEIIHEKHDTSVFEMAAKSIVNFISNDINMLNIKIHESRNKEIRFIDIALQLFDLYIKQDTPDAPSWPSFLSNAGAINRKFITVDDVKVYINNNKDNEYLLRIFMLVVTGRIKARGFITEDEEQTSAMFFSFLKDFSNSRGIIDFNIFKKIIKK